MFAVVGKCNKVNLVFPEEKDPSLQKSSAAGQNGNVFQHGCLKYIIFSLKIQASPH
jgi:hypothetical protein